MRDLQFQELGVDSFANDLPSLDPFLSGCIAEVTSLVPEHDLSNTRIYLGATAGMRVLTQEEPDLAQAIMQE